jgi:UDP-N-acetylmuramate dehydrogenase
MNILRNVSLFEKNTFRIGGESSYYIEPSSESELREVIDFAGSQHLSVFILGKGSNVLISDYGWNGLTINTSAHFCSIRWNDDYATVDGGASLNTLINQAVNAGFSGMEQLSGIPGTIGGAVIMNAGAFESCIADTFFSAVVLLPSRQIATYSAEEASFGYRTSRF